MFKKVHILAFIVLPVLHVNAQVDDVVNEKFGSTELKEDAQILISDLKACHPALYEYTTQHEFDSLAMEFELELNDSLTEEEFHIRVRKFLRVIDCGHTSAKPSEEWYSMMHKGVSTIPIHILLHKEEMYVQNVFARNADSLIGAKILGINGVSAAEVLEELKSIVGRDGVGDFYVLRNVERIFQTYYLFLYGSKEYYKVDLELSTGKMISVSLAGKRPIKRQVQKQHELIEELNFPQTSFGFIDSTKKTAVMDLNSFPSKKYGKFYRKTFKALSENESEVLILDVRGNGGGSFPNGNKLLRYLMHERFTLDFSRPKKQEKRSKYVKTNFTGKIARFNYSVIPDRNKEDPDRNYQIRFKPVKRNQFQGKVYIITDGWSFSTASYVTSKLKNAGVATVVGEETGGGEVTFNAVLKWDLTLPHTKLQVSIPMYHVDIQPDMEDTGSGVVPSIPVEYPTVEQRLSDVDLEIQKIIEFLGRN